jgi:RNA polymerase sigma-70 factor (ECF subfamily)
MKRTDEQRAAHAELMRRIAAGDQSAFAELYDEFADLVYSIPINMLRDRQRAEDAAQEIWLKVWRNAPGFDAARASVATWISTLAHRHSIDVVRREQVRQADRPGHEAGDEHMARIAGANDTEHEAITSAYSEDVRAALAQLSEEQAHALRLAWLEGYTQSEIAELTGKPLGTVKTYMYQGMRRLRELLDIDAQLGSLAPHGSTPNNDG